MNEFQTTMNNRAQMETQNAAKTVNNMLILVGVVIFAQALIIFIALLLLAKKIKPINALVKASTEIAEGNLNVNVSFNTKDEIGELSRSFSSVVVSINTLINEMGVMTKEQDKGNFDYYMKPGSLTGSYKIVVSEINKLVSGYVSLVSEVLVCL